MWCALTDSLLHLDIEAAAAGTDRNKSDGRALRNELAYVCIGIYASITCVLLYDAGRAALVNAITAALAKRE